MTSSPDFQLLVSTNGMADSEALPLAQALGSALGATLPGLQEVNFTDYAGKTQIQIVPSSVATGQSGYDFYGASDTITATALHGEAITVSLTPGPSLTGYSASIAQAETTALLTVYSTVAALDAGATAQQAAAAAPAAVAQIHADALLYAAIEGQSPGVSQLVLLAQPSNDAFIGQEMTFLPAIRSYMTANDPAGFITALYENAVGRIPEPGAIPFYEKVIAASPNATGWYQTVEYIGLSAEAHAHAAAAGVLFA